MYNRFFCWISSWQTAAGLTSMRFFHSVFFFFVQGRLGLFSNFGPSRCCCNILDSFDKRASCLLSHTTRERNLRRSLRLFFFLNKRSFREDRAHCVVAYSISIFFVCVCVWVCMFQLPSCWERIPPLGVNLIRPTYMTHLYILFFLSLSLFFSPFLSLFTSLRGKPINSDTGLTKNVLGRMIDSSDMMSQRRNKI